jgi:N6-adenosine-specific RNA methylase IME4
MKLPEKKYNIIYADPPWAYKDKALAGKRGACCKYNTESKEWIQNLPVQNISDNNCILFMWVTMPKLNECFDIIKQWGFEYKTVGFTWIKKNKVKDTLFWGMGRWTRANPELCLIATKGKIKRMSASVHSVVESKIQRHSQKPGIVRNKIIQLVGDLPRIELFARQKTEGWDVWGNEV